MKVEGSHTFDAAAERVWNLLVDPKSLSRCLPGCESFEPTGPDEYAAVLKIGIASVKGTYTGRVKVADQEPPWRCRLQVEGRGAPGYVRGEGDVLLETKGAQTILTVQGDAEIGGTIASVGQRMLGGVAKLLLNQFFNSLNKQLTVS